ncbi:creatininase family protein [bacterium]|nr:creatininase family protein [bacterium]
MERKIQRLNWHEFTDIIERINGVILPIGTMEAHGCTNLGTDITIPEFIAEHLAERLDMLIAPSVNYGITRTLLPLPGSMSVSSEHFEAYIFDIAESLIRAGFKFVVFMNGHGGHIDELARVARKLWEKTSGNSIVLHWWEFCEPLTEKLLGEAGGHCGTDETYMVMSADNTLVKKEENIQRESFLVRDGAYPYPNGGSILLYKEGQGMPRFDENEAKQYSEAVLDYIESYIREVLSGWKFHKV